MVSIYFLWSEACDEFKRCIKNVSGWEGEQGILEWAKCGNKVEMSARKQLITSKFYDDKSWGSLIIPTK